MKAHPSELRAQAEILRDHMTYKEISQKLSVSTSTLHTWLKQLPVPERSRDVKPKPVLLCSIEGCGRKVHNNKNHYCDPHLLRFKKNGDALAGPPIKAEPVKNVVTYIDSDRGRRKVRRLLPPMTLKRLFEA